MEPHEVQEIFRKKLGIRLGHEMSKYVLRRLEEGVAAAMPLVDVPVMGADAKTGVAVRTMAPLNVLAVVHT